MAKNKTIRNKITLSDYRPARLLALPPETIKLDLGTLIGRATGLVKRQSVDKTQTHVGLGGHFEASFSDGGEPVTSGVLFMPDSFINPLIAILSDKVDSKTGEVTQAGADAVMLAYRVFAVRANNAQQRSWELEAIADPQAEEPVDALAALRGLLKPQAVIEGPKAEEKKTGKK